MKNSFLVAVLCFFSFQFGVRGATSAHYSISFNATVTSTISTGTDSAVLGMKKLNNATIFNQLVATGSFSGMTAADMDLVVNVSGGTDLVDVINKHTDTVLYPLLINSLDSSLGFAIGGNDHGKISVVEDSNMTLTVPGVTAFAVNGLLRVSAMGMESTKLKNFHITLAGGNGSGVLQGTMKVRDKIYNY